MSCCITAMAFSLAARSLSRLLGLVLCVGLSGTGSITWQAEGEGMFVDTDKAWPICFVCRVAHAALLQSMEVCICVWVAGVSRSL